MCAPWQDSEGLFRPDEDYICVPNCEAMITELRGLLRDDKARQQLADNGSETIRRRHTCAHRAQQLIEICDELEASPVVRSVPSSATEATGSLA